MSRVHLVQPKRRRGNRAAVDNPAFPQKGSCMARILVIDDDENIRTMLKLMLERAGYEVEAASSGNEAILKFKAQPADLIITDLIMPEKEGLVAIWELARKKPGLKIIAMSGTSMDEYLNWARKLGVQRTFKKPFPITEMLDAVKELLGT